MKRQIKYLAIPFAVFKVTGIGSAELLEKMQNRIATLNEDEQEAFEFIRVRNGINTLGKQAAILNVRDIYRC
ncbi:MAG: hypothetical protein U5N85_13940 [Arcicella sp.]|nr:hypothetical protein [Arcicella sp.]